MKPNHPSDGGEPSDGIKNDDMKINAFFYFTLLILVLSGCRQEKSVSVSSDYPVRPAPFTAVQVNGHFWKPWLDKNVSVTIPSSFKKCGETGRIENFMIAGKLKQGAFRGVYPFDDSDVYKIIEGASYSLAINPDSALSAYLDTLISYIAAAQENDGYLHTWRTINPDKPPTDWSGGRERWSDIQGGHELYNMGHFYEAAASYRETQLAGPGSEKC
jgi:DUF1680 family protein